MLTSPSPAPGDPASPPGRAARDRGDRGDRDPGVGWLLPALDPDGPASRARDVAPGRMREKPVADRGCTPALPSGPTGLAGRPEPGRGPRGRPDRGPAGSPRPAQLRRPPRPEPAPQAGSTPGAGLGRPRPGLPQRPQRDRP